MPDRNKIYYKISECNLNGKAAYLRIYHVTWVDEKGNEIFYVPWVKDFRDHDNYQDNKNAALKFVELLRTAEVKY